MQNHYHLYQGDCLKVLPTLEDESIDLVVTSPPYNVGVDYGDYKDSLDYEVYLDWLDKIWNECFRVLRNGGRICINVGDTGRNPYFPVHCDIASRMRKKWFLMGIIVWNKQNCLSNTAWGSWMSASSPSLRGIQEFIIVAGKGGKFFRKDVPNGIWTKKEFLEYTLEIWNFPPETRCKKHPAPFPEELPKRCIKLYSYPNDVVLDPFIGSGTTMKVAQDLERSCIGIEASPEYCETSKKRCFGRQFLVREPPEYKFEIVK
jgi:site-specific DNA-methyltransferase (adenine-specific)